MSQDIYSRLGMTLRRHEHHKRTDNPHHEQCALVLAAKTVVDERRISQTLQLLVNTNRLALFGQPRTALFSGAVFQWLKPDEREADPDHAACLVTITYHAQTWYPTSEQEADLLKDLDLLPIPTSEPQHAQSV